MNSDDSILGPPERPDFSGRSDRTKQSAGSRLGLVFALLAALVIGRTVWVTFQDAAQRTKEAATQAAPQLNEEGGKASDAALRIDLEEKLAAGKAQAEFDAVKSRQREFKRLADQATRALDEWDETIGAWQAFYGELLDGADGRLVAADVGLVRQFRAAVAKSNPTRERLEELRESVAEMVRPVAAALENPDDAYRPDESLSTRLKECREEAIKETQALRYARSLATLVVDDARRAGKTGATTLRAALDVLQQEEDRAALEAGVSTIATAQQEKAAEVAAAAAKAIKIEGAAEAAGIMSDALAEKERQAQEAERQRAEEARAKRRVAMDKDLPEIKRVLAPFIAAGYAQPAGYHNRETGEKGPMSLSRLDASGALKPTREGMEQLMRYATVANDREHASFPQYVGGDYAWQQTNKEYVGRAQELLRTHGEALVEAKFLAP